MGRSPLTRGPQATGHRLQDGNPRPQAPSPRPSPGKASSFLSSAGSLNQRRTGRARPDATPRALTWEGILVSVQRRFSESESDQVRQDLLEYMVVKPCQACGGKRLKPESLAVTINGKNLGDVGDYSIGEAQAFVDAVPVRQNGKPGLDGEIAGPILKEVRGRLRFLVDVGLDCLTLGRAAESLSGGEAQRIRLATQIGSRLVGVLYILDEPSIGLHQRDNERLLRTLETLRDLGNTVIVVEHDEETIRAADYVIDLGPGAGKHGGEVVAAGTLDEALKSE